MSTKGRSGHPILTCWIGLHGTGELDQEAIADYLEQAAGVLADDRLGDIALQRSELFTVSLLDKRLPVILWVRYRQKRIRGLSLTNPSFSAIVAALLLLIAVAAWQFHSLVWGDGIAGSYTADKASAVPERGVCLLLRRDRAEKKRGPCEPSQLTLTDDYFMAQATLLSMPLTLVPTAPMEAMAATAISELSDYSTLIA